MMSAAAKRNAVSFRTEAILHGIKIPDTTENNPEIESIPDLTPQKEKEVDAAIAAAMERKKREFEMRNKRA